MFSPSRLSLRPLLILTSALALSSGLRAQSSSASTISDSEILRQFEQRRILTLDKATTYRDPAKNDLRFTVAANFYRRANLAWANAQIPKFYAPKPADYTDMFWMYPLVAIMEAGRQGITAANQAYIKKLWSGIAFPYRGDTENHWLIYYTSLCLAAEANPDAGPEAWFNGKSSAENIAEAHSYIEDWMAITTSYGQGEFDSPNYLEEYTAPLALLAGWETDPRFRQKAHMMLDYLFYDYVAEQLNGEFGGAHSRVYPQQVVEPGQTPAAAIGWLLFGLSEFQPNNNTVILAMSGYVPPPILYRIAHDRDRAYVERELKRSRWRVRHAGPKAFEIEGKTTVPVYKYTYMDPDFVIGSCQGGLLQPIQQETWSLIWREDKPINSENTFFGLQPYSSSFELTMFFADQKVDTAVRMIAHTGLVAKADYDSPDKLEGGSPYEQVVQNGPALIALYNIPPGSHFPLIDTFFSRDLIHREQDKSGWIFCQGGPAYFAYLPFAPGEWKPTDWTGVLKTASSWFRGAFLSYTRGNQSLVSSSLKNGYIVQVAPVRAYRSFDAFKAAVRALPVHFTLDPVPEATFTTLDGSTMHARYGGILRVNDVPVPYGQWPLFDSPYGHSARESQRLEIQYGPERYVLDFKNVTVQEYLVPDSP